VEHEVLEYVIRYKELHAFILKRQIEARMEAMIATLRRGFAFTDDRERWQRRSINQSFPWDKDEEMEKEMELQARAKYLKVELWGMVGFEGHIGNEEGFRRAVKSEGEYADGKFRGCTLLANLFKL
jgi:hypothetical protein